MKRRILSCCLALCIIATLVPIFNITADAALGENEAIYSVNQNTDGITDNVIVASYNGVSYVMGAISAEGKAAAVPAVKSSDNGSNIIVDETTANLFKVTTERYTYSGGSYWLYRMITDSGYIVDAYGNDYEEHKLITMDKEAVDASETKPYYNWRFDWTSGWYNSSSSYSIYLVVDGSDVYFKLCYGSPAGGEEYIAVKIFSKGCQHANMQYVPAVSPTCKKDGNDEYWYCPDCDENGYAPYFSDEEGINDNFNPPVTMSYCAIDTDRDGVCDDCGKNMPVFKKVKDDSQIVAGGKYILVSKVGDKYYAASTGTQEHGDKLPAVEITPSADGSFAFENTTDAMMIELQFANGCTEWGNGIRYGFITKFCESRSEFAPSYGGEFYFSDYDIRGAKYGFYVGLNSDKTAKIHSAYAESELIHSYSYEGAQQFTLADRSSDASYNESPVYLYRLTDVGTVGTNTYNMTAVKSETNYNVYQESGADAEGGTNVTGVTDALTQTAINDIVSTFVTEQSISGDADINIATSVNVVVTDYSADNSITFELNPTAVVSVNETAQPYNISDDDFDKITPMTVTLYTGGIMPVQIIHEKQDGTNEYFYPEYSEKVMSDGEKPFYELYDNDGNMYVSFVVTEFSAVRLLTEPIAENVAVTGVTIDETLSVNIGESKTPSWTVSPSGATNKNVTFTSNDTSIATVNTTTGEVTGVKKGTAVITVKTADGDFTDTCTVTVTCVHNYTAQTKNAQTLKTAGNCRDEAVYYYSCAICGEIEHNDAHTFTGDKNADIHVGGTTTVNQTPVDHRNQVAGYTGDTKCLGCNVIIANGTAIPPGDHMPASTWESDDTNHWHECSECDYKTYVATHSYDNACDTTCNVCAYVRSVGPHIYDNSCDTTCNVCGATRTITHTYDNACDTICNVCGATRTVKNHNYNDCFTGYNEELYGSWQITSNDTGIYQIKPNSNYTGNFSNHYIAVFDSNDNAIKYNEAKQGWPLVKDQQYTVKFRYNCSDEIVGSINWSKTKTNSTIFPDTNSGAWYNDAVTYAVGKGIMSGYGNGNFGPADSIQRQDFLVMLARFDGVDLSQYTGKSRFADVQTGSYYAAAVNWGADKGIVSGYQGGTVFGVGDVITREQLVTFLYRYASYKGIDVSYSNTTRTEAQRKYKDYSQVSDWSLDCVLWALENNVINGKNANTSSPTIAPQGNAQRCEVAQIMYNIFQNNVF